MAFTANPLVHFDANYIDSGPYEVFAQARDGNLGAIASMSRTPHFSVSGTTTTSSTAFTALNLSDLGVPFPVGKLRRIVAKAYQRTDAGTASYLETHALVVGTATNTVALLSSDTVVDNDTALATGTLAVAISSSEAVVQVDPEANAADTAWVVEAFIHPAQDIDDPTA